MKEQIQYILNVIWKDNKTTAMLSRFAELDPLCAHNVKRYNQKKKEHVFVSSPKNVQTISLEDIES
jgi:hypothetical protein